MDLGKVGAMLTGFSHILFFIDYPIWQKLLEFCPFMQIALPQESHVEGLFLAHTQSPEIGNVDINFDISE